MKKEKNGAKIDMLNGSIWNKLPLFALPVAATAILEQLFNASDLAVVGNFTGDKSTIAVAAVGANSPVIGLILNLFIGVALGANVIIANAIGSGDEKTVHKAVHTSIIAALLGGAVIALLGELSAGWIMNALNLPAEVYPYAMQYLRIYLLGMPVIFLYNFEAAIFRSVGDTRSPLIALFFSGLLNVALNLFFVIVLKMTVSGVATATVISNLFGYTSAKAYPQRQDNQSRPEKAAHTPLGISANNAHRHARGLAGRGILFCEHRSAVGYKQSGYRRYSSFERGF